MFCKKNWMYFLKIINVIVHLIFNIDHLIEKKRDKYFDAMIWSKQDSVQACQQ